MRNKIFFIIVITIKMSVYAQVGIGTNNPNNSSILEVKSANKGLLIPRMTRSEIISINTQDQGL